MHIVTVFRPIEIEVCYARPMKNADETFGQKVRRLRMSIGMSQADLADRIGVSRPHMSVIEHDGVATVLESTMRKLEDVLGPVRAERKKLEEALSLPPTTALEEFGAFDVNNLRAGLTEVSLHGELSNAGIQVMRVTEKVLCITQRAPDPAKNEVLVRVKDSSLDEWGIHIGDYAVVRLCGSEDDAAIGDVVIATVNGKPLVKRLMWRNGSRTLESEGSDGVRIIRPKDTLKITGVLHRSFALQFHSRRPN